MRHDQSAPSPEARRVDGGIIATLFAVGIALLLSSPGAIAQAPPDISPYVAQLAQYGSVAQLTELSNRRRLTTLFVNEQSPFYGVQVSYVNVHRGNLTFLVRDLVRQGQIPIVVGRVYDSEYEGDDFGPGWKLSIVETIERRAGQWIYMDSAGAQYALSMHDGRLTAAYPHLTGIDDVRIWSDRIELSHGALRKTFERAGAKFRLVNVQDAAGHMLRIEYRGGSVSRILTSRARSIELFRDPTGRIVGVRDDAGRRVTYEYNAQGQLVSFIDLGSKRWQIGYDERKLLAHVTDPRGAASLTASFDKDERVSRVSFLHDSTTFEYRGSATHVKNALQREAVFWHHASGVTTKSQDFSGAISEVTTDELIRPTQLSFNGRQIAKLEYVDSRLRSIIDTSAATPSSFTFTYDAAGRVKSITRDEKLVADYTYDALGNLTAGIDARGERKYAFAGIKLRSFESGAVTLALDSNDLGQLTMFGSPKQRVQIDYDRYDRVAALGYQMPQGTSRTRYGYNEQGLRSRGDYTFRKGGDAKGPSKRMEASLELNYDAVGNLIGLFEEASGKTILSQNYLLGDKNQLSRLTTNGHPMDYEYDAVGRIAQIRTDGRTAAFEYDSLGRLESTSVNGQRLFKADYAETDLDLADPDAADAYSPVTYVAAPVSSAVFGSMQSIVYARTRGSAFGVIRFHPTMGRFVLTDVASASPDAVLLASLQRRGLPIAKGGHHGYSASGATVSFAPVGFDKPSNGLFLPPEFSTLNCYQCYGYISPYIVSTVNGSTAIAEVMVGQQVSVDNYDAIGQSACFVPDGCEFPPCYQTYQPQLQVAYGDGSAEYGWLGWSAGASTFLHSYSSSGNFGVQSAVSCGFACAGAQFIQVAAATVKVCFAPSNYSQVQSCPSRRQSSASYVLEGCNTPFFTVNNPANGMLGLESTTFGVNQGNIPPGSEGQISPLPCSRHDLCYGTCGSSRATCDNQFETNTMNVCRAAYPEHYNGSNSCPSRFSGSPSTCNLWAAEALSCEDWAENYTAAVRLLGQAPFEAAQVRHCTCCP